MGWPPQRGSHTAAMRGVQVGRATLVRLVVATKGEIEKRETK
jgi:hypothetical protein